MIKTLLKHTAYYTHINSGIPCARSPDEDIHILYITSKEDAHGFDMTLCLTQDSEI